MTTQQQKIGLKFELIIELPHPPSVNSYWTGGRGGSRFLSKKAREFKLLVKNILIENNLQGLNLPCNLSYHCEYYPPDLRKRDLDNFAFKGVFDSLRDAQLFIDDDQFIYISAEKREKVKDGKIIIYIKEL